MAPLGDDYLTKFNLVNKVSNKTLSSTIVSLNENAQNCVRKPYRKSGKTDKSSEFVILVLNELTIRDIGFIFPSTKDAKHGRVQCLFAEVGDNLCVKPSYNYFNSQVQSAINKAALDAANSDSNSNLVFVKMNLSSYDDLRYLDNSFKIIRIVLKVGI